MNTTPKHTPIPWIDERLAKIDVGNSDGKITVREITTVPDNAGNFNTVGYVFTAEDSELLREAVNAYGKVERVVATIARKKPEVATEYFLNAVNAHDDLYHAAVNAWHFIELVKDSPEKEETQVQLMAAIRKAEEIK